MDQREINNGTSKFEVLDADGGDVAALIRALPRVEAPANFEFGVRAKIAHGSNSSGSLIPFLKLAAPLSLLLLVGAFVVFYGFLPEGGDVPVAVDTARTDFNSTQPKNELAVQPTQPVERPENEQQNGAAPERASVAPETRGPVRRSSNSTTTVSNGGGSFDIALGSAKPKLPPGFESASPKTPTLNSNGGSGDTPVRDVLEILGIKAIFAGGGWQVSSVTENTVAARAKLLIGDVIQAIDGQPVGGDSTIKGSVTNLTIRRDGKTIGLKLGN